MGRGALVYALGHFLEQAVIGRYKLASVGAGAPLLQIRYQSGRARSSYKFGTNRGGGAPPTKPAPFLRGSWGVNGPNPNFVIPRPTAEESAVAFAGELHYRKSRFLTKFVPGAGFGMT